ncbi:MAG: PAS domain-containing protein [Zetaproteobacteria bacterium]|nr:PAS domain-containing protein [Zetaproteobacteria bacterium]
MQKQIAGEVFFDGAKVLVSRTDRRGVITFANKAFCETSGYTQEELIGKPHNLVRHPDMPAQAFKDLWNTLEKERCWTGLVKNKTKNGRYYWVRANVSPEYDLQHRVIGFISVRTRPTPKEVAEAERCYADVRAGKHSLKSTLSFSLLNRISLNHGLALISLMLLVPIILNFLQGMGVLSSFPYENIVRFALALLPFVLLMAVWRVTGSSFKRLSKSLAAIMRGEYSADLRVLRDDELAEVFTVAQALQYRLACEQGSTAQLELETKDFHARQKGMAARLKFETANEIDAKVESSLESVEKKMDSLGEVSEALSAISEQLSRQSEMAAYGVSQSLDHASVTAAAAEEMSATIGDLTTHAQEVQRVTEQAVVDANAVNETVRKLGAASQEIGSVLVDIRDIARQTNLLALNASIEAQHAGDAGKGFAVVAGEVKSLAEQTARATGDIERRIQEIQQQTQTATDALHQIAETIVRVNEYVKGVAASMQEQTTATMEIAEAAQKSDAEMRHVQEGIRDVESASVEAARLSTTMLTASDEAKRDVTLLEDDLQVSLKVLRKDGVVAMLLSHQDWKGRIESALQTRDSVFNPSDVAKVEFCALGKWLAVELETKHGEQYAEADRLHRQYHACAGAVLEEALQGNHDHVMKALSSNGRYSVAYAQLEKTFADCGIQ